jgi:hypothetical protein
VLNGNAVPGTGEAVAERIIPGGFRVAVSQNASDFDHAETLIVVGSPDDVALAERVRDLLGVGTCPCRRIRYRSSDDRRREGLLRVTTSERRRAG